MPEFDWYLFTITAKNKTNNNKQREKEIELIFFIANKCRADNSLVECCREPLPEFERYLLPIDTISTPSTHTYTHKKK